MKSKHIFRCALLAVVVASMLGCAGSVYQSQLDFGIRAAQSEMWEEAIFRWKKVVAENPESVAAHNNLAVAYEKKGMITEAKQEYEIATKLAPDNKYVQSNFEKFQKRQEQKREEKDEKK